MKYVKRLIAVLLLVVMLVPTVVTESAALSGYYDSDWRYWSQGGSGIGGKMKSSGCYVVSQAKLLVESGVVDDLDSFDPDVYVQWAHENGYFGSQKKAIYDYIGMQSGGDKAPQYYAEKAGKALNYCGKKDISKLTRAEQNKKIMEWLNEGYYIIIGYTGHRLYILHDDSISNGSIKISNTQSTVANSTLAWADNQKRNPAKYIVADFMSWKTNISVQYALLYSKPSTSDDEDLESSAEPTEEPTTGTSTPINVTVIAHPDEGTYTLTPKCAPNNRLDVDNGSKNDEANIQVYKANNTASQQFEIKKTSDGYYEIVACVSGKALDMSGGNSASKTNIWQYRRNSTAAQKWQFEDAGDGYYYIVPYLNEGLCLDVAGGTTASGANVWAYEKNQGNAQKWMLTKVEQTVTPVVKNYKDGVIGENDMRVRSGPGTSYQHIGTIPSGSIVQVYTDKTSGNWYYVKYNDLEGYVYKNGITIQ